MGKRGQRNLMHQIRRKTSATERDAAVLKLEEYNMDDLFEDDTGTSEQARLGSSLLPQHTHCSRASDSGISDVFYLKRKQEEMVDSVCELRKENDMLWHGLQQSQER